MQSLKNGTQLGGYTLIRLIARGGMGEVYEAHEAKLQRRVALKVIAPSNPDEHDRDDLVRRFMQEARTLARVNHPNVVTIYSIDTSEGVPFIAMEYVDGVSFRQLLEELTFTVDGALPLFLQMLEGMKSLHDNRIIHRDLKPHNILLRPDGQIKILDFGIAKHVGQSEHTRVGVIVGTLPYMAPELKNGSPASMRSDLWSLGAIFFECLTGKRLIECMPDRYIEWPPEALQKIPGEFRAILSKMCAHKQSERYLVAEQVIEDVRHYQLGRPPVPNTVWTSLSKKVESIAERKRKEQDMEIPPSSPADLRATDLIKAVRSENSQDAPTRVAARASSGRHKIRPRKRNSLPRAGIAAGLLLAIVVLSVLLFKDGSTVPSVPTVPASIPPGSKTPPTMGSADTLALKEPADQQMLWLEPTRIPTLAWTRPLNPNEYEIQIAKDDAFKRIVVQEPVAGTSFRPERVLEEGPYHWRLRPRQANARVIGPNRFTVSLLTPVDLISPDSGRNFDSGTKARTDVDLKWVCKPGAKLYLVQIATDPEFHQLAQEKMVNGCEWSGALLVPGAYYWRVRMGDVAAAEQIWTFPRAFIIKASSAPSRAIEPRPRPATELTLSEPKIKGAQQILVLEFSTPPRDLASLKSSLRNPPVLEWRPVRGAARYKVQFSSSRDFVHLLSEESASAPRLEWKGVVPGRTYWRVSATTAAGEDSPYSSPGQVMALLPAPQINSVYKFVVPANQAGTEQLTVDWPASPLTSKYLVQMGPSRDLAGLEERLTKSNKVPMSSQPGQTFFRVAAASENGEAISADSTVASVEFEAQFPIEKPKTMSPKSGARAPSKQGRISVVFSWSRVQNADNYTFELSNDPEFKTVIERRDSKNRGTLLQQAELKGRVYWRVKASGPAGSSDWSEPAYFDVK